MKIVIDAREAFREQPMGKGFFARHVIEELQRHDGIDVLLLGEKVNCQPSTVNSLCWHLQTSWDLLRRKRADLYLSPTSYLVPWLIGGRFPCAIVIHDLIAFSHEPHETKAKLIERLTLPRVLRIATHIFTVSEATKRELLERFPKTDPAKITVVYEGPTVKKPETRNQKPRKAARGPPRGLYGPANPYILSIGTICPRKNQLRLIQAYNALPETTRKHITLILIGGRGWADEEIVELARRSPNVEWRGYIPAEELTQLLAGAHVFAYLSLAEGFGLPVLDALTLGIPTLTSNRSSLPEVAGDAAVLIDPESIEEIREGLLRLLLDEGLRKALREKGPKQAAKFSWTRTADLILEALKKRSILRA